MPQLHQIIERHWQRPNPFLSLLLKPLSKLFAKIAAKRRDDFVSGRLKSEKLPVPVVVVGNIHAGGTGKTPIVAALASGLQEKGVKVGIISRGYGRKSKAVHVLNAASRAEDAGDEPFTGLDPISLGVIAHLISRANKALRSTSVMVTHDIERSLEIVDQVIFLAHGEIMFSGSPEEMRALDSPWVRQFVGGLADGPVAYRYPAQTTLKQDLLG